MTEDVAKQFEFPNFTTLMPSTLREVLENDMAPREQISLNGLGIIKGKAEGLYMMLKRIMEVAQYYTVFDYGPPSPQKYLKYQFITIVAQPWMNPVPKFVLPGHSKEKTGKEPPPTPPICVDHE